MKFYPTALLLLAFMASTSLFSQDTLVTFQELTFNSDFEKRILEDHLIAKNRNPFMLAMASNQNLGEAAVLKAQTRFYNHLSRYENDKFRSKKNDKKIKQVYSEIHEAFLTKYEIQNKFEDIFNNGYYNCVSATLLYSLAFEKLGIPYHVIEKPTHVYLVAYPDAESIVVETTAPMAAFFTPTDQFKQNYIKVLKDQKLISAQEFNSNSTEELFNKYYFGELKNITIDQLAGIQYLNEGIYLMDEDKNLKAMQQFEKSYLLYPNERSGYLLMVSAYKAFSAMEVPDETHALCLAKMSRYKRYGVKNESIQGEFAKVVQTLLFDNNNQEAMEKYYDVLIKNLHQETTKNDIAFIYNYEFGRMLYNQSKYKESLSYLENVLKIKPSQQEGNSLFLNSLFRSFRNLGNAEIITSLQSYGNKYPSLLSNALFKELLATTYLIEFDRNFQNNNALDGERYRAMFEKYKNDHKDLEIDETALANAYSSAAVYYFRKGQNSKAKSVLSAGLAISPENYELKMRKKMID